MIYFIVSSSLVATHCFGLLELIDMYSDVVIGMLYPYIAW